MRQGIKAYFWLPKAVTARSLVNGVGLWVKLNRLSKNHKLASSGYVLIRGIYYSLD